MLVRKVWLLLGSLALITLIFILDQYTKQWAVLTLTGQPITVCAWLNLHLAYNQGTAFSLLAQASELQRYGLLGLTAVVVGVLCVWLYRVPAQQWRMHLALSLVVGGALGNLYDRVLQHHVIDFIDAHLGVWHWPTFNLADSAICIGVALLAYQLWREQ